MISMLKKDFRMGVPWLVTGLLIILLINLIAVLAVDDLEGRMILSAIPLFLHILYFPIFLGGTLERESKQMHLWLHSPRPAWQLLLSKVLSTLTAFLLSFGFSLVLPAYLGWRKTPILTHEGTVEAGLPSPLEAAGSILSTSLYLGFLFMLFWVIQQSLKSYTGKWGSGITIGIILFTLFFTPLLNIKTKVSPDQSSVEIGFLETEQWTNGLLWSFPLMLIFFLLSAWLLERKTEV